MVAVVCVMNFQIVLCESNKQPLIAVDLRSLDAALPLGSRHNLQDCLGIPMTSYIGTTDLNIVKQRDLSDHELMLTGIDHHIENLITVYRRESAYSHMCCSYEIHYLLSACYRGNIKPCVKSHFIIWKVSD
jgi:hypothetical protein